MYLFLIIIIIFLFWCNLTRLRERARGERFGEIGLEF
jgi:hypothetical protein